MKNERIVEKLTERFGSSSFAVDEFRGECTITLSKDRLLEVCRFLKEDSELKYDLLSDVAGLDMYTPQKRFFVVYNLFSLANKHRLRLKTFTEEDDLHVPSVTPLWRGADWMEREAYDMFGILFDGHPDLRRIYMPDEFEHFPLRKDFPLMGIPGSIPLPKK